MSSDGVAAPSDGVAGEAVVVGESVVAGVAGVAGAADVVGAADAAGAAVAMGVSGVEAAGASVADAVVPVTGGRDAVWAREGSSDLASSLTAARFFMAVRASSSVVLRGLGDCVASTSG